MLARLRFDIDGDVQYSRAFEVLGRAAENLSDPLREMGDSLLYVVEQQFVTEGKAEGAGWKELSRTYGDWKDVHFPGMPMLVRSGAMRNAALSPDTIRVTPHSLTYEVLEHGYPNSDVTTGQVAFWHQKGKGRLPERKIVELSAGTRRDWDRIIHRWIIGRLRGPMWRASWS